MDHPLPGGSRNPVQVRYVDGPDKAIECVECEVQELNLVACEGNEAKGGGSGTVQVIQWLRE